MLSDETHALESQTVPNVSGLANTDSVHCSRSVGVRDLGADQFTSLSGGVPVCVRHTLA